MLDADGGGAVAVGDEPDLHLAGQGGIGVVLHRPFSCQVSTTHAAGSHTSTVPQSHSVPSTSISYQRPPALGSITAWWRSAAPMWWPHGHQLSKWVVGRTSA